MKTNVYFEYPETGKKSLKYVNTLVDKSWIKWVQHTLHENQKRYTKYIPNISATCPKSFVIYNILIFNKLVNLSTEIDWSITITMYTYKQSID